MSTLSTSNSVASEETKSSTAAEAPQTTEAAPTASPAPAARKRPPRAKAVVQVAEVTAPAAAEVQVVKPVKTKPAPRVRKSPAPAGDVTPVVEVAAAPETLAKKTAPAPKKGDTVSKPVKAKMSKAPKAAKAPEIQNTEPAVVKHKLIRDSFTFPENEYAQIEALKSRALAKAYHVKKSEVLRAGIAVLSTLSDAALLAALKTVPALKTGRPKSGKTGSKKR